ncbi:hypothetical protein SNE40_007798 [Patella caerulea]|uniref:G-protein coupled receptors family 1 profile domain-containing protein n=1 Tax=Patella caerulea TaxID=87958 RepID=A0AAN8K4B6_PATCE
MDNLVNSTITAVKENLSGSSNATMPVMPDYISVTSTLLYVIIFIVGIIGNGLVITVVAINKDMRNSTNTFLVNLAVADLLVILICMPPALAEIFSKDQWFFGEVMCK